MFFRGGNPDAACISTSIVLAVLVFVWDVGGDYMKWKRGIEVNHRAEWAVRCLLLTPTFVLLGGLESGKMALACGGVMGSWWILWFDGIYNVLRKMDFWHQGSPIGKTDDSWTDIQLRKLGRNSRAALKIGAVIITTCIYIRLA